MRERTWTYADSLLAPGALGVLEDVADDVPDPAVKVVLDVLGFRIDVLGRTRINLTIR